MAEVSPALACWAIFVPAGLVSQPTFAQFPGLPPTYKYPLTAF